MTDTIESKINHIRSGRIPAGYRRTNAGIIPGTWETKQLRTIVEEITETPGSSKIETISISAGVGFVNQAKKFGKELSGRQYEKYIVLHRGDFSYNKGNSSAYPQGCIYRLTDREQAAVPNVFESFRIREGNADYYEQLFISGFLNQQLCSKINRGVRDNGLLNLTGGEFYSCEVPVPPIEEQRKIAEILTHCDRIISLHRREINEFKKKKDFFSKNMFPRQGEKSPQIRFPNHTGPWEQRRLGDVSESYSGGTPTVGVKEYYGGEIPFIRSAEINSDATELFLTEEGLNASSARLVSIGDILYALYGATSGEVGRARLKGAINQAILAIKPHTEYDAEFLAQWLRKSKRSIIETYLQGGQGNLSGTIVKELLVEFPSLQEQQQITIYVSEQQ